MTAVSSAGMSPAGYIDQPTRERLEEAVALAEQAVHERDVAIMEAVEAGISLRTVEGVTGINRQSVSDIAKRTRAELEGREWEGRGATTSISFEYETARQRAKRLAKAYEERLLARYLPAEEAQRQAD